MNNLPNDLVGKYFDFLVTDFGFRRMPGYDFPQEYHTPYIKKNVTVIATYSGSYIICIQTCKTHIPELENGTKRSVDFSPSLFQTTNLFELDKDKQVFNSIDFEKYPERERDLAYSANILQENLELLDGTIHSKNDNLWHDLLKFVGLKK